MKRFIFHLNVCFIFQYDPNFKTDSPIKKASFCILWIGLLDICSLLRHLLNTLVSRKTYFREITEFQIWNVRRM